MEEKEDRQLYAILQTIRVWHVEQNADGWAIMHSEDPEEIIAENLSELNAYLLSGYRKKMKYKPEEWPYSVTLDKEKQKITLEDNDYECNGVTEILEWMNKMAENPKFSRIFYRNVKTIMPDILFETKEEASDWLNQHKGRCGKNATVHTMTVYRKE